MPLFGAPITAFQQITRAETTPYPLPTADTDESLLDTDPSRRGHLVRNTGNTEVTVSYGLKTGDGNVLLYAVTLAPIESYLYDLPEVIPYSARSKGNNGTIQVIEMF